MQQTKAAVHYLAHYYVERQPRGVRGGRQEGLRVRVVGWVDQDLCRQRKRKRALGPPPSDRSRCAPAAACRTTSHQWWLQDLRNIGKSGF